MIQIISYSISHFNTISYYIVSTKIIESIFIEVILSRKNLVQYLFIYFRLITDHLLDFMLLYSMELTYLLIFVKRNEDNQSCKHYGCVADLGTMFLVKQHSRTRQLSVKSTTFKSP